MKKSIISYTLIIAYLGLSLLGFFLLQSVVHSIFLVILIATYFFNVNFAIIIFFQNRNLSAKFTWLIIIVLLPIVGNILFLIFGQIYIGRQDLKTYQNRRTFGYEVFNKTNNQVLTSQSRISKRGVYNANFTFFDDIIESFEDLFKNISQAKKHIHMHWFILKPGEIYDHMKNLIIKKAREGVKIRLIFDDLGSWTLPAYEIKELRKNAIEIQFFGKILFPFINSANVYRTHRKIVIIDSKIVYHGGINVADEYASLSRFYGHWLDLQVKITGGATRSHVLLFIEDWNQMTGKWLEPKDFISNNNEGANETILVEDSPEISSNIVHDSLLNLIFNAKRQIVISSPYFAPSDQVMDALKIAASKGIEIKIFVPGLADKRIALYTTYYHVYSLAGEKIKFYKIKSIYLHTKMGMFDHKIGYFGSVNFDKRSFYSQLELINLFTGPGVKEIHKMFNYYEKISTEMKAKPRFWKYKKWFSKFIANIFSPLI